MFIVYRIKQFMYLCLLASGDYILANVLIVTVYFDCYLWSIFKKYNIVTGVLSQNIGTSSGGYELKHECASTSV